MISNPSPDALRSMRVLDFTRWVVGPWAPRLLAHFGAEVIKLERTDEYEGMRRSPTNPTGEVHPDKSGLFNDFNADKLAITLNVRHPEGRRLVEQLMSICDAVVENFSAGV